MHFVADVTDQDADGNKALAKYGIAPKADNDQITRGEFALIVDALRDPFSREVDIKGNFITE